tara:strand:+ start:14018 stop:14905 length:888 start_codon:yes stop_codon:yes gene_type:complete
MANIIENIREVLGDKQINLTFLTDRESVKKTYINDAVKAGFTAENVHFTTELTKSHDLAGTTYMCSDELFYRYRNVSMPTVYHEQERSKKFTALVRTHKEWRAYTMARLWSKGLHESGYFGYNNQITVEEDINPIDTSNLGSLKHHTEFFLKLAPFHCDLLTADEHANMKYTVGLHHSDAYFNFIIESELTGPVRLTEKVFKAIKNCQPFVIAGPLGSIKQLQEMGYRTFDHVVDHSYDQIVDTTERWEAVCAEMCRISKSKKAHSMYVDCKADLLHNQNLFLNKESNNILICLK